MTQLLDGKAVAKSIEEQLKKKISSVTGRRPGLAFVIVGDQPASHTYVQMKKKACKAIGIVSKDKQLPSSLSQAAILKEVEQLNQDPSIDGILIQLPLPAQISPYAVMEAILPEKDVDGFHPLNMGRLLLGETNGFIPCTPLGIKTLLNHYKISIAGKHVVIMGRSNIVGKPLAALLMQKTEGANATVTVAHSASQNLKGICKTADILISAMGNPHFVTAEMVKKGAVVVDVGINRTQDKITGDVDFDGVAPLCTHITPVPGGVGPMTIAMLMSNTWLSFERRKHL